MALAAGTFLVFAMLALAYPYKLREPDPYAYRASIKALASGNLTLNAAQLKELDTKLLVEGDGWKRKALDIPSMPFTGRCDDGASTGVVWGPAGAIGGLASEIGGAGVAPGSYSEPDFNETLPIGVTMWTQLPTGRWVSEKNIGYPFLTVFFDSIGLVRLAPLFYGAIACFCLWFGAARWLGRWGAAFAVGLFLCPGAVLIMGHRAYMPSFTNSATLAAGAGLVLWTVLATDAPTRRRALVGALGFFLLGTSVTVRYTNAVPAVVIAGWTMLAALRPRWRLRWCVLPALVAGALVPAGLLALYNERVFGGLMATGYERSRGVGQLWYLSNVSYNLRVMPARLVHGVPTLVLALVALLAAFGCGIWLLTRRRSVAPGRMASAMPEAKAHFATTDQEAPIAADSPRSPTSGPVPVCAWVIPMLLLWWCSLWGLLSFFGWTWMSIPKSANLIISVRFYLPAAGAIALLGAWLLARLTKVAGIIVITGFFVLGAFVYVDAVTGNWLFSRETAGSSTTPAGFQTGAGWQADPDRQSGYWTPWPPPGG